MSIQSDGVVASDFTQILTDFGRSVSYQVVTKTTDPITGSEVSSFASAAAQTVIFFLEENRYIWDKEGLLQVGDAYVIATPSLGIKRYDQLAVDGVSYYIENVTRRLVLQTTMSDYATLFKVTA